MGVCREGRVRFGSAGFVPAPVWLIPKQACGRPPAAQNAATPLRPANLPIVTRCERSPPRQPRPSKLFAHHPTPCSPQSPAILHLSSIPSIHDSKSAPTAALSPPIPLVPRPPSPSPPGALTSRPFHSWGSRQCWRPTTHPSQSRAPSQRACRAGTDRSWHLGGGGAAGRGGREGQREVGGMPQGDAIRRGTRQCGAMRRLGGLRWRPACRDS